ncbi:hypothetical protein ACFSSC_00085 [Corynebacterium mendelii]|uniref:DUF1643 domain-containing protein n=1 Tax=Corynebacterium mendelii TaxID=2765362 RepID=A0A939IX45_9CORY|nr:hypothetical protein [Corynebacterium mendelii]MBN9643688.1 hypothetical protein [Corynebacterium mendelii]
MIIRVFKRDNIPVEDSPRSGHTPDGATWIAVFDGPASTRRYFYAWIPRGSLTKSPLVLVGLNPSTAASHGTPTDPTVTTIASIIADNTLRVIDETTRLQPELVQPRTIDCVVIVNLYTLVKGSGFLDWLKNQPQQLLRRDAAAADLVIACTNSFCGQVAPVAGHTAAKKYLLAWGSDTLLVPRARQVLDAISPALFLQAIPENVRTDTSQNLDKFRATSLSPLSLRTRGRWKGFVSVPDPLI